jgi:dipeptidyl-peptidase-4
MRLARIRFALPALLAVTVLPLHAQDRLKSMPGCDRYTLLTAPKLSGAVKSGRVNVEWAEDGTSFGFTPDGKSFEVQAGPDAGPLK